MHAFSVTRSRTGAARVVCALAAATVFGQPAVAAGESRASTRLDRVVLQLDGYHRFEFAGFYAAQTRGYYRDAGLAVTILEAEPGRPALESLYSGHADFAVAEGADGLLARSSGRAVVACAVIMQHSPDVILTREGTGIRTPSDLVGRRVMIDALPLDAPDHALLLRSGVSSSRIHVVAPTQDTSDLVDGRVDAMVTHAPCDLHRLSALGVKPVVIDPRAYGIDFYGDTIFATSVLAGARPGLVNRFRAASRAGWEYAMAHPEEIADEILRLPGVQERGLTRNALRGEAKHLRGLLLQGVIEIGHMNPERWQHMAATLADLRIVHRPYSLQGFLFPSRVEQRARLAGSLIVALYAVAGLAVLAFLWAFALRRAVAMRTADLRAEVTARKEREDQAARLASFPRNNPNPVVEVSCGGEVLYMNPAAERLLVGLREQRGEHPFLRFCEEELDRLERGEIVSEREAAVGDRCYQQSLFFEPAHRLIRVYGLDVTTRKKAEEKLRASDQRLALTLEAAEIGTWDWDLVSGEIDWSERHFELFGLDPHSVKSSYELFASCVHPADLPALEAKIAVSQAIGGDYEHEYRVIWPDGTIRWLFGRGRTYRDDSGRPVRMLGIARDVTERRISTEELRHNQQLLSLHVRQTPLGVIEWDTDLRVRAWNPGAERIFGYMESEALGRRGDELMVPEDERVRMLVVWNALLAQRGGGRSTNTRVTRDGRRIICEWYNTPLVADDGAVIGVASLVQDVTDQVHAEQELRASRERLLRVLDSVPVILFALDREGRFVLAEGKGLEIIGVKPDDVVGVSIFQTYSSDLTVTAAVEKALAGEAVSVQLGLRDTGRVYEVHLAPACDADGRFAGATGVAVDVTEARALAGQLEQAQRMETVGRLAGGIAHDFNNLLTAILGYADLASGVLPIGNPGQGYVEQIRSAAERAADLTRRLLTFARRQMVRPKVIDLRELIGEMEPMLRKVVGAGVEVAIRSAADLWPIEIDPGQMEQVLVNLAVNARDAMEAGGHLAITVSNAEIDEELARRRADMLPGPYVLLEVADDGSGMSEEVRARAFEPFFTTKEVGRGTGLGLSTCHGIVRQAGGQIDLESEPGRGTAVRVYLPRSSQAAPAREEPAVETAPRGTERILLVEDDPLVREMAASALSACGYDVRTAKSGEIALCALADGDGDVDLMITDAVMPDVRGQDLARQVSTMRPGLKVLFVSGYTEEARELQGLVDEGAAFLSKPFSPAGLARKVRSVLDRNGA